MVPLVVEAEVQSEGLVQIRLADVPVGQRVRVTIEGLPETPRERVFGRLRGLVEIMPSFNDPIPGFE